MKLTELNQPLRGFDGQPIMVPQEKGEAVPFQLKVALLNCLGSKKPEDGQEAIAIVRLGTSLFDVDVEVGVGITELLLLKAAVEQNNPSYTGLIQGQLMIYLESVEQG